jgi:undecaprenyl-diphosphatase
VDTATLRHCPAIEVDHPYPVRGGPDQQEELMDYIQAVVLGVVEGLTEFLPVSSTGHLTVAEKLLGLTVDDPAVTGFTAVIQMGAIAAVVVYFWRDIWRIAKAWVVGIAKPELRGRLDHRMGWYIIVGSIPIGLVGFVAKDVIKQDLRSLWVVAAALVLWSAVMLYAEKQGRQHRGEKDLTLKDALVVGVVQCVALVPGVSRSGATISTGLLVGLDRVTATRLSFFLSIPALLAAGIYELKDALGGDIGLGQTLVGTAVSFVVAYGSVAWLLRFVAGHSIGSFVPYRVTLGVVLLVVLGAGWMTAT